MLSINYQVINNYMYMSMFMDKYMYTYPYSISLLVTAHGVRRKWPV